MDWVHQKIQTVGGLFDCYIYNNNSFAPIISNTTGYNGAISTVWGTYLYPPGDTAASLSYAGIQASFFYLDPTGLGIDPNAIWGEVRFAPVGFQTFYAVQFVENIHTESHIPAGTPTDSFLYNTQGSLISLLTAPNETYGFTGLAFSYQFLNKQTNTFFDGYTIQNFFGDFAGMVGTVMGLDLIKMAAGIPTFMVAFKHRSLATVEEHFNG